MVKSPIKVIKSGTAPTTENLAKGEIAFGTVDGSTKLYGSDGTTVSELGGGGGSEVNSIAPAKVSVGAESFDGGSYDSLAIGNNARADLDEVQYHAGSSLAVGNNSIASDQGSTAIGVSSNAISGMAIGFNSRARNNGTALGRTAKAEGLNSVAIGSRSEATLDNELSVGSDSLQRRITHVATPTDAQDAATKAYVDSKITDTGWLDISSSGLGYLTGPWTVPLGNKVQIRKFGKRVTAVGMVQATQDIDNTAPVSLISIPESDANFDAFSLPQVSAYELAHNHNKNAATSVQFVNGVLVSFNVKQSTETPKISVELLPFANMAGIPAAKISNGDIVNFQVSWDTED